MLTSVIKHYICLIINRARETEIIMSYLEDQSNLKICNKTYPSKKKEIHVGRPLSQLLGGAGVSSHCYQLGVHFQQLQLVAGCQDKHHIGNA